MGGEFEIKTTALSAYNGWLPHQLNLNPFVKVSISS